MSILHKLWKDYPDTSTPINAAALMDLEDRVRDRHSGIWATGCGTVPINGVSVNDASSGSTTAKCFKAVCRVAGTYTGIRACPHGGSAAEYRLGVWDANGNLITQTNNLAPLAVGDVITGGSGNLQSPVTLSVGDIVMLGFALFNPVSVNHLGAPVVGGSGGLTALPLQDLGSNWVRSSSAAYGGGTLASLNMSVIPASILSINWIELVP